MIQCTIDTYMCITPRIDTYEGSPSIHPAENVVMGLGPTIHLTLIQAAITRIDLILGVQNVYFIMCNV